MTSGAVAKPHLFVAVLLLYLHLNKKLFDKEPKVLGIHAGLECGILSDKISGLDCISIGPDMDDIHSPKERLSVKSTANVWEFLKEVLK